MTQLSPPPSVRQAAFLMYVGAALALLYNVLRVVFRDRIADNLRERLGDGEDARKAVEAVQHSGVGLIVAGIITAAIWVLMARLCLAGHGWARILATVLGVLGVLSGLFGSLTSGFLPLALLSTASGIVAALVLIRLWRKDSSAFFEDAHP